MCKKVAKILALILFISSFTFGLNKHIVAASEDETTNEISLSSIDNTITQMESKNKDIAPIVIPEAFEKVAENEILELYLNEGTLGIMVKNKITGYVWASGRENEEDRLNKTWRAFAKSGVTIEYMSNKGKFEKVSVSDDKAKIKVKKNDKGFSANINYKNEGIEFDFILELKNDGIEVKIPENSIKETKDIYKLQAIYIYPFLGATKGTDIPGYIFLPDGSGALMRLDRKNDIATEPYIKRIYGDDFGMTGPRDYSNYMAQQPETINIPVFGVAHNVNENAFVAIIDEGGSYAEIHGYPSGMTTEFNWVSPRFIFRETYSQPVDKKGTGVIVNQRERNQVNIAIEYRFLSNENANYVGMAKEYQNYLIKKGVLRQRDKKLNDIPLRLEFFGAENKKRLIGKKIIPMTTLDEMDGMIEELKSSGVNNMTVVFRGWTKGGITGGSPNHFPFEKKVASASEWKSILTKYKENNIPIFLYTDYVKAYKKSKGFSKLKDVAQSIAEKLLAFENYAEYSYLSPNKTKEIFKKEEKKFDKYGVENIAIDTVGTNLFSNHSKYNKLTRDESEKQYEEALELTNKKIGLYKPNAYLWKNVDSIFDIPMSSSQFVTTTDTVPFLQIVLKGYVDYYAPVINFAANPEFALLQTIDYGCYPSFYLTKENPVKLLETATSWLYSSEYDVWKDEIINSYMKTNEALNKVQGATIEKREVIENGIVCVEYSNGIKILINYRDSDYSVEGIHLSSMSFKLLGRD